MPFFQKGRSIDPHCPRDEVDFLLPTQFTRLVTGVLQYQKEPYEFAFNPEVTPSLPPSFPPSSLPSSLLPSFLPPPFLPPSTHGDPTFN